jgi:phage-related protein
MNIPIIGTVWNAFKALIKVIWDFCMMGWTWLVGLIMVAVTAVSALLQSVMDIFTTLVEKLAAITIPNSQVSQSVDDWLTVANTFAPVQEAFGLAVVLSTLWVAMLGYRFLKSLIPTLA